MLLLPNSEIQSLLRGGWLPVGSWLAPVSFLFSLSLSSPLLSPFSSLSYIERLPVAFSLPSQDYSTSSDAFSPLKGFISAQRLLASLYNNGSMLARCPLSKLHAPCLTAWKSRVSKTELRLVLNKALSLWEDKFIASCDSLREVITRTEKERIYLPVCCLPSAGLEQRDLLRASSSCRLDCRWCGFEQPGSYGGAF